MAVKVDIHNYDSRLRAAVRLARKELPGEDFDLLNRFVGDLLADGLNKGRIGRYVTNLKKIQHIADVPLREFTVEDVRRVMRVIRGRGFSEWTVQFYVVTFKKFYRWLNGGKEPDIVSWLRATVKTSNKVTNEKVLPYEEVTHLIGAARNLRDKAAISVLYEGGLRSGEFLGMRVQDVEFDKYGAVLSVTGKTGPRRVRIFEASVRLKVWIDNHPGGDSPDGFVWVNIGNVNNGRRLDYYAFRKMLRDTAARAGITKRVNPHVFRHSRATHLATELTEAQMNEYFGWVQGSDMPSFYVHLSGRDVDKTLMRLYGYGSEGDTTRSTLGRKCPRCQTMNAHDTKQCGRCSLILDPKEAMRIEEDRAQLADTIKGLLQRIEAIESGKVVVGSPQEKITA